jgi:hypothetical protein
MHGKVPRIRTRKGYLFQSVARKPVLAPIVSQILHVREFEPLFERLAKRHRENPDKPPPRVCFNWHGRRHFAISLLD